MAWDFETDPEYQAQLDWADEFVRDEVDGWVRVAGTNLRYLKDPAAIYRRSFALIRREVDLAAIPRALRALAVRLVHASGIWP